MALRASRVFQGFSGFAGVYKVLEGLGCLGWPEETSTVYGLTRLKTKP